MLKFCHRFFSNCADTILPLTGLLSDPNCACEFAPAARASFERVKAILADATLLIHFHAYELISLMVNASSVAVGARSEAQRYHKALVGTFSGPRARFRHVYLDIAGRLPLSDDCFYLFTYDDGFTQWPKAIFLPDIESSAMVNVFLRRWVATFGGPPTITFDRGAQFKSDLFQSLLSFLSCTRIRTTAYPSAANGMFARIHHQLNTSLREAEDTENWTNRLSLIHWASVPSSSRTFPVLPLNWCSVPLSDFPTLPVSPRPSVSVSYLEKTAKGPPIYLRCDQLHRPLEGTYDAPFRIVSREMKNFHIQRRTRKEVVSVDCLKAALPDSPPGEPRGPLLLAPSHYPPSIPRPVQVLLPHIRYHQLQLLYQTQTLHPQHNIDHLLPRIYQPQWTCS
ncbi:hypothetical protein SprV_0802511300 [Sparganum proliferum]